MADYTNLTCPVCSKKFSAEDDIVVCPVCGTPHHRECYKSLGRCANISWHSENKTYNIDEEIDKQTKSQQNEDAQNENSQSSEKVICKRCSKENDKDALFCDRCGAPISQGFSQSGVPPFVNMGAGAFNPFAALESDELIDGVETWKYTAVVKENPIRFIPQFKAFSKSKRKTSFNLAAFFFSPFYFLYRKMYGLGVILLIVYALLEIPSLILNLSSEALSQMAGTTVTVGFNLNAAQLNFLSYAYYFSSIATVAIRFVSGFFANYIYFKKCKKTAIEIAAVTSSREEFIKTANKKGGSNRILIIALIAVYFVIAWTAAFVMINPALM